MKVDSLIDGLQAFRAKHGNVEVAVLDPAKPVMADAELAWTEDFKPGFTLGYHNHAPEAEPVKMIILVPYPDLLTQTEEQRRALFEV